MLRSRTNRSMSGALVTECHKSSFELVGIDTRTLEIPSLPLCFVFGNEHTSCLASCYANNSQPPISFDNDLPPNACNIPSIFSPPLPTFNLKHHPHHPCNDCPNGWKFDDDINTDSHPFPLQPAQRWYLFFHIISSSTII